MLKLFVIDIPQLSLTIKNRLLSGISAGKRERILRLLKPQDAMSVLMGDILVRTLIMNQFKIRNEEIRFRYNAFGKPYLDTGHPYFFNISHSGGWLLCATSEAEVGCDIEKVITVEGGLAEQVLCQHEWREYGQTAASERSNYFFHLWTRKESLLKAIGSGLSIEPKSISVLSDQVLLQKNWSIRSYDFESEPQFKIALCSGLDRKYFPERIKRLSSDELIENFLSLTT
jgi:4'-phosphopantetheinyl transferase